MSCVTYAGVSLTKGIYREGAAEVRQQAPQAEGLVTGARLVVLRVAKSKTGYAGVYHMGSRYEARISIRIHGEVSLGSFATAEEAAVRVARAEAVLSMVPGRAVKRRANRKKRWLSLLPPPDALMTRSSYLTSAWR